MAYKIFPNDKYLAEIKKEISNNNIEIPIINKYYTELRAKQNPSLEELPPNPNESQIRNYVINELSPILKNQTVNFVENLIKANDLMAFYKFGKTFLNEVKDIRNLDSSFLADLWRKYKSKMLIYAESNVPKTGLTANEYENALKHNRRVASSRYLEYPEIVIEPPSRLTPSILNRIVVDSNYGTTPNVISPTKDQKMSVLEQIKEYPMVRTKKHLLNKTKQILAKKDLINIANNSRTQIAPQGYTIAGNPKLPTGRNKKLTGERLIEHNKLQKYQKTKASKRSSNPTSTAMSTYGEGLHNKFSGRGIIGTTNYARR